MTFYRDDLDLEALGTKEGVVKGWLKRQRAKAKTVMGRTRKKLEYRLPGGMGKTHLALQLFKEIKEGGFTYDAVHALSPTDGYSVSMTKQYETVFDAAKITPKDVVNFLIKTQQYVSNVKNAHVGGWVDLDREPIRVYLDVSTVFKDFNKAVAQGKGMGEKGIFGLKEFKTYDLETDKWVEPKESKHSMSEIKWKAAKAQPKEEPKKGPRFKHILIPWEAAWNDPASVAKAIRKLAGGRKSS